MHSPTIDAEFESTQSDERSHPGNAVAHLQRAVRSGRPALIPGALEPVHQSHQPVIERGCPCGPDLSPVRPEDRARRERDREAGGAGAEPVTLLDFLKRALLRLTDGVIWLLRTGPRVTGS
jgi:hypothetical protein